MAEIMDAYWRAPPIARTLTAAIVATSFGVHFFGLGSVLNMLNFFPLRILLYAVAFLVSGPQLDLIWDPYMAYQNLSQLETANTKFSRREDLVWYLISICGSISVMMRVYTGYWGAGSLKGLIIAMCYTANQDKRGQKTNFFFFQVPAQSVPYCMLVFSMLTGRSITVEICGILSAHLHDFLTRLWPEFGMGPNLLPTPGFISYLVQTPRFMKRDYGTAVQPKGSASGSSTGASTGSVLPDSWKTRGSGHRLG